MALSFLDNIDYRGKKPNFTRDLFATVADMASFSESYLPDVFIACCIETGKLYMFNRNNDLDATLGKWREYISGSSTGNLTNEITFSTNVGNIDAGTTFPVGTSIETILNNLGGSTYEASSAVYYGVLNSSTDTIDLATFTKVDSSGAITTSVTSDNQYITFVSEKDIVEIKDEVGFSNDSEFTKSQKIIGGATYYVCISKYPITCSNFTYIIKN